MTAIKDNTAGGFITFLGDGGMGAQTFSAPV